MSNAETVLADELGKIRRCIATLTEQLERIEGWAEQMAGRDFVAPLEAQHRKNGWSAAEDDVIRKHYPAGLSRTCQFYMPHRTSLAIRVRARRIGVSALRVGAPVRTLPPTSQQEVVAVPDAYGKVWCGQCDRRVPLELARACSRPFCKAVD